METKAIKIMERMMKEETEKVIKRLLKFNCVDYDTIELLTKDVIATEITASPVITTMGNLKAVSDVCNIPLTDSAYKCIDNHGTLLSFHYTFNMMCQVLTIRYGYAWDDNEYHHEGHSKLVIPVDKILNKHGFNFEVI